MRRLLALDNPPDAAFYFNDLMALGAMLVLHTRELRIPEDIAVVGFDDIEYGHYAYPHSPLLPSIKRKLGVVPSPC